MVAEVLRLPVERSEDARLVAASRRGDATATRQIWDRHSVAVRACLRRATGPSADVEDLVQEVFLRFFHRPNELRDPAALRPYLIGIAIRVAGSELRSRRVRRWVGLTRHGEVPELSVSQDDAATTEAVKGLYRILDRLDTRSRLAFVSRHVEGMDLAETCSALQASPATVKRALAKAIDKILLLAPGEPALRPFLHAANATNDAGRTV